TDRALVEAVETGLLDEAVLDRAVGRVLRVVFRAGEALRTLPEAPVDPAANHRFARRTAAECMVLLKNVKNLLPLASGRRVAVIGPFARVPRTQGGGSSHVPSWSVDVPLDELRTYFPDAAYARGCGAEDAADEVDGTELEEAVRTAREADVAVLFLGLPDRIESEGYDRTDMLLPGGQVRLLEAVAAVRPETVVVLMNGSPVEMPWADRAEAILEAYLGGDASGGAVADILSGTVSPSGRLAETFPLRLEHNPSYLDFPGQGRTVRYTEGVFTGYRYYSTRKMEVLFPFGHGLSYTTFSYSGLRLSQIALLDNETLGVSLRVRNTGDRQGQEVVQLYVSPGESPVRRPAQELKAFAKIALEPGEERTVVFELDRRAFAWYDEPGMRWRTDNGTCRIRIGASSDDIRLEAGVVVCTSDRPEVCLDEYATLGELAEHPDLAPIVEEEIDRLRAGYGQSSLAAMGEGFAQTVLLTTPLRVMARQSAHGLDRAWMDRLLERCRQALQE
ncbi:MAG: glycoside hydrolase family 3 C-terminal domain-containing protein, partial [Clostridia bacterium]|nr:glycoside hydrolase family 3 C-terminal domain-containing protein [Clostridia bacterium]